MRFKKKYCNFFFFLASLQHFDEHLVNFHHVLEQPQFALIPLKHSRLWRCLNLSAPCDWSVPSADAYQLLTSMKYIGPD